jgi:geranylgeranyl pyrophosphate synthase
VATLTAEPAPLLAPHVTSAIRNELLDIVRSARLSSSLQDAVLKALSGPTRVLPEGKPSACAALTLGSHSSAACEESLQAVPLIAAMEILTATGDFIDDIQDDEAAPPDDRRSVGQALEIVAVLLILCHSAIQRAAETGVPGGRVLRALRRLDELGVDALRGQTQDMDLEDRTSVSVEESLNASGLKSASLTRCAAELGASLGTDDTAEIELYGRFGWHFGMTKQLMNDVAAVWPGARDKSDLRLRKKTLPVVFALNLPGDSSRHARAVRAYHADAGDSDISEEEVKLALWRCGAIHYTWIVAATEKAKAQRIGRTLSAVSPGDWPLGRLLN